MKGCFYTPMLWRLPDGNFTSKVALRPSHHPLASVHDDSASWEKQHKDDGTNGKQTCTASREKMRNFGIIFISQLEVRKPL